MSRKFRSDDTNKWKEGFGKGSQGDLSQSGSLGGVAGHAFGTFTGTSGQLQGTFSDVAYFNGSNGGRIGDIVLIIQNKFGSYGEYEFNVITGRSGTTVYFKYPLQNSYVSGAQIVSSAQWKNITITGATTPYMNWYGSAGGIIFLVASKKITINSTLMGASSGYNGGGFMGGDPGTSPGSGQTRSGYSGESYNTNRNANGGGIGGDCGGCVSPNTAAQYNGGSGGRGSRGGDAATGGAGGGHATAGTAGTYYGGSPSYNGGYGGATVGNAGLTLLFFGGGGGGTGGWHDAGSATAANHRAGAGGRIVVLLAKEIEINGSTGYINCNGAAGANYGDARGGSGGGAGGSVLLKCEACSLGTNRITVAGGSGGSGTGNATAGGAGGVGRIHVDYSKSFSGSATPTINTTLDPTVKSVVKGGAFLLSEFT